MIPDLYDRKLGFGEMFKGSWQILCRNIKHLLVFVFGIAVLLKILDISVSRFIPASNLGLYVEAQLNSIVSRFFGYVPFIATILITQRSLAMDEASSNSLFKGVKRYFWMGLWVQIITQVVGSLSWIPRIVRQSVEADFATATFLGVFIPVISLVLMVYFFFSFQALILKKKRGFACFSYSFRVVRGRWWRVAGVMMLFGFLTITPLYLLVALLVKASSSIDLQDGMYLATPFFSLIGAFMSIFASIFFLNIDRENKEGQVDELKHPADPVNPACQAVAPGEGGSKNSHETV